MSGDVYNHDESYRPGYFAARDPQTGVHHQPRFPQDMYRRFWVVMRQSFDPVERARVRDLDALTQILTFDPGFRDQQFQLHKSYYLYLLYFADWGPESDGWISRGARVDIPKTTIQALILDNTSPAMRDYLHGIFFRIPAQGAIEFLESLTAFDTHISGDVLYETIRSIITNYREGHAIESQLAQLTMDGDDGAAAETKDFDRPRP